MGKDAVAPMTMAMLISPGPALYSAARGMSDAARRMDTAAHNIANVSTDPFTPLRADGTQGTAGSLDVVTEFVDANVLAPFAYRANASVARTVAATQRALFNMLA